jgi:hypothetical protein
MRGAAAGILLYIAAPGALAEPAACPGPARAPERLWSVTVADPSWTTLALSEVVATSQGAVAFGLGMRAGESGRYRAVMAAVTDGGRRTTIAPVDISGLGGAPESARWIAAAVTLPDGGVVAVAVVEREGSTTHRFLRFAADGSLRGHRDVPSRDGPLEQSRAVLDGADRIVVLGAVGSPPLVNGVFLGFDLGLRPLALYQYPAENSAIFHFARRPGGYAVFGDWSGKWGGPAGPGAGRFRVDLGRDGRAGRARRLGPPLDSAHPNGAVFDRRGGVALLSVAGTGDRPELIWMGSDGAIRHRRPAPIWDPAGKAWLGHPRLEEGDCALLFDKGDAERRVMRIDRAGTVLWRAVVRPLDGGELGDLASAPNGGFVAAGEQRDGAGAAWIEGYGYR